MLAPALQNVLDACVGCIGFYTLGFGFAFGTDPSDGANGFIGNWDFALKQTAKTAPVYQSPWAYFFFQWSFCAATTTIVSGAACMRLAF